MRGFPLFAALVVAVSLTGCKREAPAPAEPTQPVAEAPAQAARPLNAPPQLAKPLPGPRAELARQSPALTPAPAVGKADLGDLETFTGFSPDESRFAFTVFSEGAGFHLVHVVNPAGETIQRFQLPDEAHEEKAREWLTSQGFTRKTGELPGDLRERLKATVQGGKVVVTGTAAGGGEPKVLYQADPFSTPQGGVGQPASASVAQVAPSGKRVAVKVDQVPVTEFGGITTYVIVDVTPLMEEAK